MIFVSAKKGGYLTGSCTHHWRMYTLFLYDTFAGLSTFAHPRTRLFLRHGSFLPITLDEVGGSPSDTTSIGSQCERRRFGLLTVFVFLFYAWCLGAFGFIRLAFCILTIPPRFRLAHLFWPPDTSKFWQELLEFGYELDDDDIGFAAIFQQMTCVLRWEWRIFVACIGIQIGYALIWNGYTFFGDERGNV